MLIIHDNVYLVCGNEYVKRTQIFISLKRKPCIKKILKTYKKKDVRLEKTTKTLRKNKKVNKIVVKIIFLNKLNLYKIPSNNKLQKINSTK